MSTIISGDVRLATTKGLLKVVDLYHSKGTFDVLTDNRTENCNLLEEGVTVRPSNALKIVESSQPVYEVVTEAGYSIKVNENSRFFIVRDEVVIRLPLYQAQPGDKLLIQSGMGIFGTENNVETISYQMESHDKSIVPANVFWSDKESVLTYLGIIFDRLSTIENRESELTLGITNNDLGFLRDLQMLLLNIGIYGIIEEVGGGFIKNYRLYIINIHSLARFQDLVGAAPMYKDLLDKYLEERVDGAEAPVPVSTIKTINFVGYEVVFTLDNDSSICNSIVTGN